VKPCRQDGDCKTGHCVDDVCCSGACAQCESCIEDGFAGDCHAHFGVPTRQPCAGESECAGVCQGDTSPRACVPTPAKTACGVEGCFDGVETARGACDGRGDCVTVQRTCAPYACGGMGCRTSCDRDGDCAAPHRCFDGACVDPESTPTSGAGCRLDGRAGAESMGGALATVVLATMAGRIARRRRR
jgi:hypothetical protein